MSEQTNAIGAAIIEALHAGLAVRFVPYGPTQFVFVLVNDPAGRDGATGRGIDVEVPIQALAHPDAFVRQYVQPALAQLRSDAARP